MVAFVVKSLIAFSRVIAVLASEGNKTNKGENFTFSNVKDKPVRLFRNKFVQVSLLFANNQHMSMRHHTLNSHSQKKKHFVYLEYKLAQHKNAYFYWQKLK